MHKALAILTVASLTATACTSSRRAPNDDGLECGDLRAPLDFPPEQIVNGSETWDPSVVDLSDGQALAVGALMSNYGGGWSNGCTATLIAPRVVLTAAHCVTNYRGGVLAASQVRFAVGEDAARPAHTFNVSEVRRHPAYRPGWGGDATHDIGLLVLRDDATAVLPEIEPISANCTPLTAGTFVGQDVQNVGYGITEPYDWGHPPSANTLRFWTVEEVVNLTGVDFVVDGHGESAVCNGDSGGPSLWTMPDGVIRVMGTVSWGDPSCVDQDHFARIDDSCDLLADVLGDCGDVTEQGTCTGDVVVYCSGGTVVETDCRAIDRVCGSNEAGQMRCIPPPAGCGDETLAGRCDGGVAIWCDDDEVFNEDCSRRGMVCGRDDDGRSRCVEDRCDGLEWQGRCEGDDAVWCEEGRVRTRHCADCGQTCGWSEEMAAFYCL